MPKASGCLRVCLAQINPTVGDFLSNRSLALNALNFARKKKAHLVVFPELSVCGYPPEDLLYKNSFTDQNKINCDAVAAATAGLFAVIGFVERDKRTGFLYNAAAVAADKKILGVYRKNMLPNYGVFDEKRYFHPGNTPLFFEAGGLRAGITICEDIWDSNSFVYSRAYAGQTPILINISASPYHRDKQKQRKSLLRMLALQTKSWVIYQNLVGGQDELVFDGGSMVLDRRGKVRAESARFAEDTIICDIPVDELFRAGKPRFKAIRSPLAVEWVPGDKRNPGAIAGPLTEEGEIYAALKLGTRDYIQKNGFNKVLVGVSGGIDSALVAAIAVDALGAQNVIGVTMPSPYTSQETYRDSKLLASRLGIHCFEFRIDSLFSEYKKVLESVFAGHAENIAEENLQARIRGNLLMALSNKFGYLVLTTGNKSEIATGYCTLYGDMAGGFAVIKDVPKTMVFRLAQWRNKKATAEFIPESIIARPPSAELRMNQRDEDSLPAYDVLDKFIDAYVEKDKPLNQIISRGFDKNEAVCVARMIDLSEYKRRQTPPGVKITPRAFGRDRRMPITNRFHESVE